MSISTVFGFAQKQDVTYTISPNPFEESANITITFDGTSINEAAWGVSNNALYLWSWSFDSNLANLQDCPTNGDWTNSNEANRLTYNSSADEYTITFTPTITSTRTPTPTYTQTSDPISVLEKKIYRELLDSLGAVTILDVNIIGKNLIIDTNLDRDNGIIAFFSEIGVIHGIVVRENPSVDAVILNDTFDQTIEMPMYAMIAYYNDQITWDEFRSTWIVSSDN